MVHLACISLPHLPLQVLQRQESALRAHPVAVVESGRGQAAVLHVNAHAWRRGIHPGMHQAAALALVPDLQTRVVPGSSVSAASAQLVAVLRRFTAHVEADTSEPGLFWLSARGLGRLYGNPQAWSEALHAALDGIGWRARVVAGYGHFTTRVVARASVTAQPVTVFSAPEEEQQAARRVPLRCCGVPGGALEVLTRLGMETLGDLLRLPAEGLLRRFGPELYRLHRLATGTLQDPLQPQAERLAVRDWIFLEPPEDGTDRLLFRIKGRLPFLLAPLAARREALHVLRLHLRLENRHEEALDVRPSRPTRQERLILDLLRLRLERLTLSAGVTEIRLEADGRPREFEQPSLLPSAARRDLRAANHALAQLRAEFGEDAVAHAVLREEHLPEARFAWEPLAQLEVPRAQRPARMPLVRRILGAPQPLPAGEPQRALAGGGGSAARMHGPFVISGGWWDQEHAREYYLAEANTQGTQWLYRDPRLGQWFRQGWVE